MTIYQLSKFDQEHYGYEYFSTLPEAKAAMAEFDKDRTSEHDCLSGGDPYIETQICKQVVRCSKAGLLLALNRMGSHPNNG